MTPFSTALSGAAGGLAAGFVAQAVVTLFARFGFGWAAFQGPHGPPFFPTALFLGVFYGVIAAAISRSRRAAAIGFAGPVLGMIVPLVIMENTVTWNWGGGFGDRRWLVATVAAYSLGVWGTISALGWNLGGRWLGVAAAVGGSATAYGLLTLIEKIAPALLQGPWRPTGFLPQFTVLLDGLFTGALLGLSVSLARRHYEKASRA